MTASHHDHERVRTADILGDILRRVTELMRMEFDLARTEIAGNLNRAAVAIGMLVAAVVLFLVALNVLAAAAVSALTAAGIDPRWASLMVAAALAVIATGLALKGRSDLKLSSMAPDRSVEELRKDARLMRRHHKEAHNE